MHVAAVRRAFPPIYATQDELVAAFRVAWSGETLPPVAVTATTSN